MRRALQFFPRKKLHVCCDDHFVIFYTFEKEAQRHNHAVLLLQWWFGIYICAIFNSIDMKCECDHFQHSTDRRCSKSPTLAPQIYATPIHHKYMYSTFTSRQIIICPTREYDLFSKYFLFFTSLKKTHTYVSGARVRPSSGKRRSELFSIFFFVIRMRFDCMKPSIHIFNERMLQIKLICQLPAFVQNWT